jgi:hypothetical protein
MNYLGAIGPLVADNGKSSQRERRWSFCWYPLKIAQQKFNSTNTMHL